MSTAPDRQRLGIYPMVERTDYQEQRRGQNAIIHEQITYLMRVVCYNQVIYDDLRLESREFLGLTLEVQPVPFFTSIRTDTEHFFGDAAIQIIDDDGKNGKIYNIIIILKNINLSKLVFSVRGASRDKLHSFYLYERLFP